VSVGGEDGDDGVASWTGPMVSTHPMLDFDVTDHRFDGRAPAQLTLGSAFAAEFIGRSVLD
jgi:hypothetical protein